MSTSTSPSSTSTTTKTKTRTKLRVLQVQIVHRHGDRTPITPLRDVAYWESQLPRPEVLDRIAFGTRLVRGGGGTTEDDDDGDGDGNDGVGGIRTARKTTTGQAHGAAGRGPFGQLTSLGLLQMVELGGRIREELLGGSVGDDGQDDETEGG